MVAPLGLSVPLPDWPVVGNFVPVAFLFTLHIAVAEFSLGAITLAAVMETVGYRSGAERHMRYARAAGNAYYLVFSLGATFAVFAVMAVIGLWGGTWGVLLNRFFGLVGIAFGIFFVLAPLLVLYRNSFGRMSRGKHLALAWAVVFWQTLFMVCIVVLDAYQVDPGQFGWVRGVLNAPYAPLLFHRLVGNVSWTALLFAGWAALRMTRAVDEPEHVYQAWAARINLRIGVVTGLLMPALGFLLMEVLRLNVPGFFGNLVNGQAAYLFVVQAVLLGVVFVGANVALAWELPSAGSAFGRLCVALSLASFAVGVLPSQVLGNGVHWVRYAAIGAGLVVTLVHVLHRSAPLRPKPAFAPAPGALAVLPFSASVAARRALVVVGLTAMSLSLLMGYMKEEARGSWSINGELTQQQSHGQWNPQGIYP